MKSLLHQNVTPFTIPPECSALPCRAEVPITIRKNGRLYRFVLRDKLVPEDIQITLTKAAAFAISQQEPYNGQPPERSVKDFLIKDQVII